MTNYIKLLSEGFEQAIRDIGEKIDKSVEHSEITVEQLQCISSTFMESVDKLARSIQLLALVSGMNAENTIRERGGYALAYDEAAFDEASERLLP